MGRYVRWAKADFKADLFASRTEFRVEPSLSMPYTLVYGITRHAPMTKTAKIFLTNRSQAVRLPKEFQFKTREVFIRKEGNEVILSPRPSDWNEYLAEGPVGSPDYMENVEDLPVQERRGQSS
jgi:antitoxin VapB